MSNSWMEIYQNGDYMKGYIKILDKFFNIISGDF